MTVPNINTVTAPSVPWCQPETAATLAQGLPLRSHVELRPVPTSARLARLHARNALRDWHMTCLADTVEVLVSEIVSNAIRASACVPRQRRDPSGPRIQLWLASDLRSVLIQVWDGDRHHPVCQEPAPDAEAGRGLLLVEALSQQWGSYAPDGQSGKIVWAVCAQ